MKHDVYGTLSSASECHVRGVSYRKHTRNKKITLSVKPKQLHDANSRCMLHIFDLHTLGVVLVFHLIFHNDLVVILFISVFHLHCCILRLLLPVLYTTSVWLPQLVVRA